MIKITFGLLWAFVFSLPFETFFVLFNTSFLTRLLGAATVGAALLTVAASGRLRRPGAILWLGATFTLMTVLSLLWTISPGSTAGRVLTYAQLLGLVWLLREFARTPEWQRSLMVAYCLGGLVSIVDLLRQFMAGQQSAELRYSGSNLNPNDLGLTLAIGIPMAWYLCLNRARIPSIIGAIYLPAAAAAILLTASRAAFIAGGVASTFALMTIPFRSFRSMIASAGILFGTVAIAVYFVPEYSWNRVLTTREEFVEGSISGRVQIWNAGIVVFRQQPLLGSGAGAFEAAVEPLIGPEMNAHNLFIAVLVEQGVLGLLVFCTLLAALGFGIYRLPVVERKLWVVIGLTWLVGVMTGAWQYRKITWLLFGLVAAQAPANGWSRTSRSRREIPARADHATTGMETNRYV